MPVLQRIGQEQWQTVPWRNGGGVSQLIWAGSDDTVPAGIAINRTPISAAGPFSSYPGITRLLVVVSGRLELGIDGVRHRLSPSGSVVFSGAADVTATPSPDGADVFNLLMNDRWALHEPRALASGQQAHIAAEIGVVHVTAGRATIVSGNDTIACDMGDTILVAGPFDVRIANGASLLVTLTPNA